MNNTNVGSDFNGSTKSWNQVLTPSQTKSDHGKARGKSLFLRIHSANQCFQRFGAHGICKITCTKSQNIIAKSIFHAHSSDHLQPITSTSIPETSSDAKTCGNQVCMRLCSGQWSQPELGIAMYTFLLQASLASKL